MNVSIHNPYTTEYFIACSTSGDCVSYGTVEPSQQMDSGLDTIEIFTDMQLYLSRLGELGITLDDED